LFIVTQSINFITKAEEKNYSLIGIEVNNFKEFFGDQLMQMVRLSRNNPKILDQFYLATEQGMVGMELMNCNRSLPLESNGFPLYMIAPCVSL